MNRQIAGGVACLAPHLDDAALSCGGLLARCREQARATRIVTVFAGLSPSPELLTPLAREAHQSWGDPPAPVALRRSEDERAAAVLGSTATWWPYLDAIYRDPKYDSWEQIAAENVEEHALVEELRQRCAALSEPILLFPLAVGHHVDHQVVFRAGWALQQTGRCVAFYEDLPYTAWKGGPQTRLAELAQVLHPQLVGTTESWPAKLEAVSAYASQLDALSHEGVSVLEFLDRYGASLLPGGRAERLWWPQEGVWI